MEQALPSPSDGWHACSRRCQLALDLTARGTGFTHPSCTLRETALWLVVLFHCVVSNLLLSWKKPFQSICDFSLSFSWQKGDRPDNDLRWAMQHPGKKSALDLFLFQLPPSTYSMSTPKFSTFWPEYQPTGHGIHICKFPRVSTVSPRWHSCLHYPYLCFLLPPFSTSFLRLFLISFGPLFSLPLS